VRACVQRVYIGRCAVNFRCAAVGIGDIRGVETRTDWIVRGRLYPAAIDATQGKWCAQRRCRWPT